ncbi:hypothetical protein [Amycolatopsis solani]|uniref:hypothetical protein n=1 Tax=Amycolatopsis solani TaxID=3028615 RepID=UPI0025B03B8E|nr:hypothetical protein [Amycolatopsis sp. MEP2-6]
MTAGLLILLVFATAVLGIVGLTFARASADITRRGNAAIMLLTIVTTIALAVSR